MRATKSEVKKLLLEKKYAELCNLECRKGGVLRLLRSVAYDREELIFWRAIEATGHVTSSIAETNPEGVRNFLRRLIWALSDESGDMAWSGPEMLAEIFIRNPVLCQDVALIVINLDEPVFRKNAVWAAGRIACEHPEIVQEVMDDLLKETDSQDPEIRAYAAWALGCLCDKKAVEPLKRLTSDTSDQVKFYSYGTLKRVSVSSIAKEALARIAGESLDQQQ